MRNILCIGLLLVWALLGAPAALRGGPFDAPSTLPYQAPRFDMIKDSDYQPAFEAGMKQQLAEIDAIADNKAAPTFDNTIVAMEQSGRMLDRVNNAFFGVVQANTNPALDKVQTIEAPKLAAHNDAIYPQCQTVRAGEDAVRPARRAEAGPRSAAGADALLPPVRPCRRQSVRQRTRRGCRRSTSRMPAWKPTSSRSWWPAPRPARWWSSDKAQLAGLDAMRKSPMRPQAAKARKLDGKYVIPLQNTTQQPLLTSLADRAVREKLFNAQLDPHRKGRQERHPRHHRAAGA